MILNLFKRVSNIQILLNMASSIAMIVDSIVIGKFLGLEAIAAYGAVTPLLMIIMAMAQVLSTGGQILCSKELGHNNSKEANGVATLTLMLGLAFSIVAVIITITLQNQICTVLGVSSDAELLEFTRDYMIGFMIGAPAFVGMLVTVPFVQLDGDKKCVMVSVIAMTLGDIAGDLFIALGTNLGMLGIGLASSVSYYVGFAILLFHFTKAKNVLKLDIRTISFKESGTVVSGGLPAALQKVLRSLLSLTLNYVLMAIGGSSALGIFSVVNSIINLCNSLGQGMGAGTLLISGIYAAEKDKAGLKEIVRAFVRQSLVLNIVMFVLVFIAAVPLISLFTSSSEVDASQAALALRLGAIDFVFFSIANCFKNLYQGLHNQKLTYFLTVAEAFVFSALFAWPLGELFGVNGVCMVYAVGDLMTLVFLSIIVASRKHVFSLIPTDLVLLPPEFTVKDEDYYKTSLISAEQLEKTLAETKDFMHKHQADEKTIEAAETSIKELGNNIFAYGFKNEKNKHLDLSLVYENGRFIMLLRDDCAAFDPVAYHEEKAGPADRPLHGIDKIFSLTHKVRYLGTLGLNNTTLTF